MIQLGSILAVMWLYRAKILRIISRLGSIPDARHFALMILVAFAPAVIAGVFLADYVTSVLYTVRRCLPPPSSWGDRDAAGREVSPGPHGSRRGPDTADPRAWNRRVPGPGDGARRVTIRRHDRGGMLMGLDRAAAAEFWFFWRCRR